MTPEEELHILPRAFTLFFPVAFIVLEFISTGEPKQLKEHFVDLVLHI